MPPPLSLSLFLSHYYSIRRGFLSSLLFRVRLRPEGREWWRWGGQWTEISRRRSTRIVPSARSSISGDVFGAKFGGRRYRWKVDVCAAHLEQSVAAMLPQLCAVYLAKCSFIGHKPGKIPGKQLFTLASARARALSLRRSMPDLIESTHEAGSSMLIGLLLVRFIRY